MVCFLSSKLSANCTLNTQLGGVQSNEICINCVFVFSLSPPLEAELLTITWQPVVNISVWLQQNRDSLSHIMWCSLYIYLSSVAKSNVCQCEAVRSSTRLEKNVNELNYFCNKKKTSRKSLRVMKLNTNTINKHFIRRIQRIRFNDSQVFVMSFNILVNKSVKLWRNL